MSRLHLGTAYPAELWPEARWHEDIRLMKEIGLSVARLGEFAWSNIEPSENEYHLDWLERIIGMLAEASIACVLVAPAAAPPGWLIQRHAGILAKPEDGRQAQFGKRFPCCINSPEFQQKVREMVEALGVCFGHHPNVIGWQLAEGQTCACERCRRLFQSYLQAAYGDLHALNEACWRKEFTSWEQIPLPTGDSVPSMRLAFKRFITESCLKFQKLQLDCLKPHLSESVWVAQNIRCWGKSDDDPHLLSRNLDKASWDGSGSQQDEYLDAGATHDFIRGVKRQNYWLIESHAGGADWSAAEASSHRGKARLKTWRSIAHGADAVLYGQWRTNPVEQERYPSSLLDQSGQPRPFCEEAGQISSEFARLSDLLVDSQVQAKAAFLVDFELEPVDFDYRAYLLACYHSLARSNTAVDFMSTRHLESSRELHNYKILFAPALSAVNERQAEILKEYLSTGGSLVLTLNSGVLNEQGALLPLRQPGLLGEMAGVEVEETYPLENAVQIKGNWFEGSAHTRAERLRPLSRNTCVIARYGKGNSWLKDQVAITVVGYRTGLVYYVGAWLDEVTQQIITDRSLRMARIAAIASPDGVEVRRRVKPDGREIYFFLNHLPTAQTIKLPWKAYNHLQEQDVETTLELAAYDVAILTVAKEKSS